MKKKKKKKKRFEMPENPNVERIFRSYYIHGSWGMATAANPNTMPGWAKMFWLYDYK